MLFAKHESQIGTCREISVTNAQIQHCFYDKHSLSPISNFTESISSFAQNVQPQQNIQDRCRSNGTPRSPQTHFSRLGVSYHFASPLHSQDPRSCSARADQRTVYARQGPSSFCGPRKESTAVCSDAG